MHNDKRFIHTRTGEVIEVTGTDAEMSKIVTITATGRQVRPRTVKTASLKTDYTSKRGTPWRAAFVAVSCLPEGHAMAPQPEQASQAPAEDEPLGLPDFSVMDDEQLAAYGNAQKAKMELHKYFVDRAKEELKRRHPDPRTYLRGNVCLEVTTNLRFDDATARKNLTPAEYEATLIPKPDAKRAREILGEKRYKLACKDHGVKLEIRTATDNDRRRIAELEETIAAKAEVDAASMAQSDDPFLPDFSASAF